MKLPFVFKNVQGKYPWQWPSCKQPKTLSFRASDDMIKTVNSVFFDQSDEVETPDTWFTTSSGSPTFSTQSEVANEGEESGEVIVRELLYAERLFFDPDETRSIIKEEKGRGLPFEESVVLAMESEDPYVDFRRSMEEMVETHGLKDWECLEELLGWYLKANGKKNHGFIVGAFVDLLVGMVPSSSSSSSSSSDSDSFASCFSSPPSPLFPIEENETNEEDNIVNP